MVDLGIDGLADVSLVGKGGTASVYQAANTDGDVVAVKVFAGVWDDDRQRRFERECEAMEALNHIDGVVRLLSHGRTSSGVAFFSMPFYKDGSLQDALDKDGPYRWRQAISIVSQIAATLQKTHDLGIYHRDLKPANVLLDDGCPLVTDFGITEIADGRSVSTMAAYTPGFCPPEALTKGRKGIDGTTCDVYALGSTLWTLLTAKQPFVDEGDNGTDPMVLLNRLTTEPLDTVPGAPDWVNNVIARATAKDPSDRYESIPGFGADLMNEGAEAKTGTPSTIIESGSLPTVKRTGLDDRQEVGKPTVDLAKLNKSGFRLATALVVGVAVLVIGGFVLRPLLWGTPEATQSGPETTTGELNGPVSSGETTRPSEVSTTLVEDDAKGTQPTNPETESTKSAVEAPTESKPTVTQTTVPALPRGSFSLTEVPPSEVLTGPGDFPAPDIYFAVTVEAGGGIVASSSGSCNQPSFEGTEGSRYDFKIDVSVGVCTISFSQVKTSTHDPAPSKQAKVTGII